MKDINHKDLSDLAEDFHPCPHLCQSCNEVGNKEDGLGLCGYPCIFDGMENFADKNLINHNGGN